MSTGIMSPSMASINYQEHPLRLPIFALELALFLQHLWQMESQQLMALSILIADILTSPKNLYA
jgi:hypothetical protein